MPVPWPLLLSSSFTKAFVVVVVQSGPALCDRMDCCTPDFPVLHDLPKFAQTLDFSCLPTQSGPSIRTAAYILPALQLHNDCHGPALGYVSGLTSMLSPLPFLNLLDLSPCRLYLLFWLHHSVYEILIPLLGLKLHLLHWKLKTLTTGPPGKSLSSMSLNVTGPPRFFWLFIIIFALSLFC